MGHGRMLQQRCMRSDAIRGGGGRGSGEKVVVVMGEEEKEEEGCLYS